MIVSRIIVIIIKKGGCSPLRASSLSFNSWLPLFSGARISTIMSKTVLSGFAYPPPQPVEEQVLMNEDLLRLIFGELDPTGRVRPTYVCKTWSQVCLDSWWNELNDLKHLFELLGSMCLTRNGSYVSVIPSSNLCAVQNSPNRLSTTCRHPTHGVHFIAIRNASTFSPSPTRPKINRTVYTLRYSA
jgi:hypothetical protein